MCVLLSEGGPTKVRGSGNGHAKALHWQEGAGYKVCFEEVVPGFLCSSIHKFANQCKLRVRCTLPPFGLQAHKVRQLLRASGIALRMKSGIHFPTTTRELEPLGNGLQYIPL
jgi:hypothetical protein